jgi:hypothetical protein
MTKTYLNKTFGLLLFAAAILSGCSATTNPTTGATTTDGSMVATVNGATWSSTVVPGGITGGAKATRSTSTGIVTVTGVKATDLTEITLILHNPSIGSDSLGFSLSAQGEYSQGVPDTSTAWLSIPSLTSFFPGSVTITTFDTTKKLISGRFRFIGRKAHNLADTVIISGGSFQNVGWD